MYRAFCNLTALAAVAALAAACASNPTSPPSSSAITGPAAEVYKIGKPYEQDGVWYYPREQPDYDETGVASWYGSEFHGQRTSLGEIFDANALTAAHRTLPMPVNVRVTNLENGRSLVVRVNDRGPFSKGRIIDVSRHAAELLGFKQQGTARVRVTYMGRALLAGQTTVPDETPPEIANAVPAAPSGKVDTMALNTVPGALNAPPPQTAALPPIMPKTASTAPLPQEPVTGQVTEVQVPRSTHLYVQAGAFGSIDNANRLKSRLTAAGDVIISPIVRGTQTLFRVRLGPFNELGRADAALAQVVRLGSNDAQIVVDE